jgi:hypothetical protein
MKKTERDRRNAPADAGEHARPEPEGYGGPHSTPDGAFLLIMHDDNVSGGLWMRRYATKADALVIAFNYTGARETWLFEVSDELNMADEQDRFWRSVDFK